MLKLELSICMYLLHFFTDKNGCAVSLLHPSMLLILLRLYIERESFIYIESSISLALVFRERLNG